MRPRARLFDAGPWPPDAAPTAGSCTADSSRRVQFSGPTTLPSWTFAPGRAESSHQGGDREEPYRPQARAPDSALRTTFLVDLQRAKIDASSGAWADIST